MNNTFTQEQINNLLQLICGPDQSFLDMMARACLESSVDIVQDMSREHEEVLALPDENDIRQRAEAYFTDFSVDFGHALRERIKSLPMKVKASRSIEVKAEF